tara:strand:- start:3 stop:428 length:426 start_codon:yes stop_codon:yes gene_type:complete
MGFVPSITDPEHPDYTNRCPLPIRVKIAGKEFSFEFRKHVEGLDAKRRGQVTDMECYVYKEMESDVLKPIIKKHAIPLPVQMLEYARVRFIAERLNPAKNELLEEYDKLGIMDMGDVLEPNGSSDQVVKDCISILNEIIDG